MSLAGLLTRTITVISPAAAADPYGNVVSDWANATRVDHPGWLEQRRAREDTSDRDFQEGEWFAALPPEATVTGGDRLEVDGLTLEVLGPPAAVHSPAGLHHLELRCRWIEG